MILAFKLHYKTRWGQHLAVVGNAKPLGDNDPMRAMVLDYQGGGYWGKEMDAKELPKKLSYRYVLVEEDAGSRKPEWGDPRQLELGHYSSKKYLLLKDSWRARDHPEQALYTSAFKDVILRQEKFKAPTPRDTGQHPTLRFQIDAPQVPQGLRLTLLGNIEELGNWDREKALLLGCDAPPRWEGSIALRSGLTVEYKYGLADAQSGELLALERGENRVFSTNWLSKDKASEALISDTYFNHPGGPWRGTGIAMPVFSIRSERGLGVGEFPDIKGLVDWAVRTGMNMVQILPVNDTSATGTWTDSYPYAAISVFALHPLYLNLDGLPGKVPEEERKELEAKRDELNRLDKVDYEAVVNFKLAYGKARYASEGAKFLKSASFAKFFEENKHWLAPYAAFCFLRDTHGSVDFNRWGEHREFSEDLLQSLLKPGTDSHWAINFYFFLQYHLDKQLGEAAAYARDKGIILKGDIPIGIYRYSVDAWVAPGLYNMDGQSGAPPDPFSETGQNWGFPTYNWTEMARDNYRWWQQRLQQLSRYFDTFRIDHILGFFRIWEIPLEQVQGLMGHFNPALPIRLQELDDLGIPFNRDRFCKPFIVWKTLEELFGQDAHKVRTTFLHEPEFGRFELRPEFDTQRKIETYFDRQENAWLKHLREGLYALVAEMLFFEVPSSGGEGFHPRILMQKTRSFQALPAAVKARLDKLYVNYFYRRQDSFWRQQAMTKLPAIKEATNMLICGEDLGMVPDCVPGVMKELGILSLEIQRMSKNPETEFLSLRDIPYMSVCSPSTHDMLPIRAWWEELEPDARDRFFREQLGLAGTTPLKCEPAVAERVISQHLGWPCMWAVFPVQDLLAMDESLRRPDPMEERINIPANPKHYWRYRLHLSLNELDHADDFNENLRQMIQASGRSPSKAGEA